MCHSVWYTFTSFNLKRYDFTAICRGADDYDFISPELFADSGGMRIWKAKCVLLKSLELEVSF